MYPLCPFQGIARSLDQYRIEDRQKTILILIANEPDAWNFAPLPIEKQNARRTK